MAREKRMSKITDAMKGQVIVDAQLLDCCGEVSEVLADYGPDARQREGLLPCGEDVDLR